MVDFAETWAHLEHLLGDEEQRGSGNGLGERAFRQAQRENILHELATIEKELGAYRRRFERLAVLPDRYCIRWAQNILAYPNGRLLLVDTLFPAEAAVLLQVLVLDFAGRARLRHCVATDTLLASSERTRLGISAQEAQAAISLEQLWPALLDTLSGCYLLTEDLRQVQTILEHEAHHLSQEPAVLIGDSLLPWFARYYQASGLIGLTSLCALVSHPLPPFPTITERALGQLALLQAMAQGITRGCQEEQAIRSVRA